MTSCHNTISNSAKFNSWYIPIYEKTNFLKRIENLNIVPCIPPLGSVGLTATYIALKIRKNANVNVYISGLDFSFSAGKTHANGAPASTSRLINSNKLNSIENYNATYNIGTYKILDKSNKNKFTNVALNGYANIFNNFFSNTQNLFDITKSGIKLNIPFSQLTSESSKKINKTNEISEVHSINEIKIIKDFCNNELEKLQTLKEILSSGQNIPENERNKFIFEIIKDREYLFLHFPDGSEPSLNIDFLKRIRTEIDFFIKDFNSALKNL